MLNQTIPLMRVNVAFLERRNRGEGEGELETRKE